MAALASHLAASGWRIRRLADVGTREHGVDLLVERDGRRQAIEAKGYPSTHFETGDRAGERRASTPTMARSYMGGLLLEAALLPATQRDAEIALALPAKATYLHLLERLRTFLERLGIGVYLVHEDGHVDTMLESRFPDW